MPWRLARQGYSTRRLIYAQVADDLTALILPLGAHHLDLMFMDDDDPPEATFARSAEGAAIDRWVGRT